MTYTQENFQDWVFGIDHKMATFTKGFAEDNDLKLDYSSPSLNHLEQWILKTYHHEDQLIEDHQMLDLLGIYIGETFRKYIGGTWFMDTENQKNAFYMLPVLSSPEFKGVKYKSPLTYATASIDRKEGNYISTILKNNMQDMEIFVAE